MTILPNYQAFSGRHYETGTLHNALSYQKINAPHTGKPVSEALLMGISGGAAFGYFTFEYEGYHPHIVLLTRNTFNPLETLLERLPLPHDLYRTDKQEKGITNLMEALESGHPAIVWADMFTLPYNDIPYDANNWAMMPLLVYGVENGTAYLADRSGCPLTVPADTLTQARARVKKDEFRVMTLHAPDWGRLPMAVSQGIWQTVSLCIEAPPKGKRDNFGLAALQHWATMLTNTRNKHSWARYFEPGLRMWLALVGDSTQPGAYSFLRQGENNTAERGMYADFLDEAALILKKPALNEAAALYRQSEKAWSALTDALLPSDIPVLHQAKTLLDRKRDLFYKQGMEGVAGIRETNAQLKTLQQHITVDFPMTETEVVAFRQNLSEKVMAVHNAERDAVVCLQAAMS